MHNTDDDLHEIQELRAMARVYTRHGYKSKSDEMLDLAHRMEMRLVRAEYPDAVIELDVWQQAVQERTHKY